MTDFLIKVIVDPSKATPGMDKVDGRLKRLEKSGKRLGNTLRRAFTLVAVAATVRQVGIFADSLTNVQNRLRLVTNGTKELTAVTKRLFDIAAKTRTGFSATATIFARTALAVKDLGLSLQETLDFTEALNQAIVLSGVKAQEANAGLIQLSQGLASGTLRGDELRSVLEQLPKVADLIADELGVARGELRLLGEQGLITTADIIRAFSGLAAADLKKAFADSIPTLSQGFSVLTTRIIQFIGKADESSKISETLSRFLITLSVHLDTVAKAAIVAGAALAGPFAKAGVLFAARAVTALTAAIALNPFGALAILIIATVVAIDQFGDSLKVGKDGLVSIRDVAIATWNAIVDGLRPVIVFIGRGFADAINFVIDAFATLNITFTTVLEFARSFANRLIAIHVGIFRAIKAALEGLREIFESVLGVNLTELVDKAAQHIKNAFGTLGNIVGFILHGLNLIATELSALIDDVELPTIDPNDATFTGNAKKLGVNILKAFNSAQGEDFIGKAIALTAPVLAKIDKDALVIANARAKANAKVEADVDLTGKGDVNQALPFAVRSIIRSLGEESEALQLTSRERIIQNKLLETEAKLRAASVTLTDPIRDILKTLITYNVSLEEEANLLEDLNGPQDDLTRMQEILNTLLLKGKIGLERYNEETRRTKLALEEVIAAQQPYAEVLESINGPIKELTERLKGLNALYDAGTVSLRQVTDATHELAVAQAELNIANGEGSFADGFLIGLGEMAQGVTDFTVDAALEFGEFFDGLSQGFSNAIGNAIVFGDSIKESIGNAARSALASLLSGLIDVGIQFLLNSILAKKQAVTQIAATKATSAATVLATTTTTAAAITSNAATTTAVVAGQGAVATAAAPAAALTSVSSFGGAAIAGIIGLIAILALAKSFKDGGFVSGPGTSRSDSIAANLSNGEFVVNAESTSRFRDQLEAINNGEDITQVPTVIPVPFRDGGIVHVAEGRLRPQIGTLNAAVIDSDNSSGPAQSDNEVGSAEGETGAGGVNIVNVLDPSIVEDFLDTPNGERVIINLIEKNASSIAAIVGSN